MSKEVDDAKSRLVSMALKLAEGNKKLEAEKQKVMKERKRADAERNKLEEQRKIAEAIRNQAEAEKSYADSMSWQLEETKLRVEKEKCCSDKLSQQLEEARVKIDELQKQIYDLQCSRNRVKASAVSPEKYLTADSGKMKLLEKQLKFEKKQLKQAKQVAKLEKRHNVLLREVLGQLKLDLVQFSNRLDLVDNFLHKAEGIGNLRKKKSFIRSYLKKRKRELDTIESIELFHSEGKKLHLQMGEII
ncbi:myosin-7B-like [Mangifera indica]|uniref:myosin-7B-like n=1 Tax=Mangifera indica TaxID=29780 RepID=UPI001CFA65BC|nr:myosin-7B-like [Mangifera indica]